MKRLYAAKFLARNTFPKIKGWELTHEKNKIVGVIDTAIKNKELIVSNFEDLNTASFLWWASEKKKTKRSSELKWPWLGLCVNLPFRPITGGGTVATIEQCVVPSDKKECQEHLVKAWRKNAELQKRVNELTEEVNDLRVKRDRRVEAGKDAAEKHWRKNSPEK